MGNLFLSFTIAIGGAVGLVSLSKALDFESDIYKMLPVIPILYAVIYEFFEHRKRGRAKAAPAVPDREDTKAAEAARGQGLTGGRIITDVAVSFGIKFTVELFVVLLFFRYSGQSFGEVYGSFGFETVGAFLRGEHPWVSGSEGVPILALIALITCIGTGLWIGYTTKGKAVLEGVIAGAAITVVMSMTDMLILYRKIEEATTRLVGSTGYAMRAGFLIVIAVQVLLYGLWSGLVQMGKEERAEGKGKKPVKKPRK